MKYIPGKQSAKLKGKGNTSYCRQMFSPKCLCFSVSHHLDRLRHHLSHHHSQEQGAQGRVGARKALCLVANTAAHPVST